MKLNFENERVLAVVAHPDDAELFCAGTLARARQEGAAIAICVLCRGDKGQPSRPIGNLSTARRKEMRAAARLLGARLFLGGLPDSELLDGVPQRRKLIEIFRQFAPTLVLAHSAEDYHPDHRAASALADAATWCCASRGYKTSSAALKTSPALWWMDTMNLTRFNPEIFVNIADYVVLKTQMLACHASQLERGRDADFSPLAELMKTQFRVRGAQAGVAAAEAFRVHNAFKRARAW